MSYEDDTDLQTGDIVVLVLILLCVLGAWGWAGAW